MCGESANWMYTNSGIYNSPFDQGCSIDGMGASCAEVLGLLGFGAAYSPAVMRQKAADMYSASRDLLPDILSRPSCAALFSGLPGGESALNFLDSDSHLRLSWDPEHDASLWATTTDYNGTAFINFNSDPDGSFINDTALGNADTIVHEMLHAISFVYNVRPAGWSDNDGGDDPAARAAQVMNQQIVKSACF